MIAPRVVGHAVRPGGRSGRGDRERPPVGARRAQGQRQTSGGAAHGHAAGPEAQRQVLGLVAGPQARAGAGGPVGRLDVADAARDGQARERGQLRPACSPRR